MLHGISPNRLFKIAQTSNMTHNCLVHLVAPYNKITLNVVGHSFLTEIVIADSIQRMILNGECYLLVSA